MAETGFCRRAREQPDRVALIDEGGQPVSAGHLKALCNRIADKLLASGLKQGDVVATLLPSSAELVAFVFAIRELGMYLLPLNPRAGIGELRYLLQDSNPALLVIGRSCVRSEFCALVLPVFGGVVEWIDADRNVDERLRAFLGGASDASVPSLGVGNNLYYTSGTTGLPKCVVRDPGGVTSADIVGRLLAWYERCFGITSETPGAFLSACPVYLSGPMSFATYAIHLGRPLILMRQWNARLALFLVAKHQVVDMFVVPHQLGELVSEYRSKPGRYDASSLKAIIHGSAHCPPELKERALDTFGEKIYECYGSTEVAGTVAMPSDARLHKGTVGRAIPPQEVRVLDDSGRICSPGQSGKIYMKMLPGMKFRYKGDAQATEACQLGDFATVGDVGYLNDDGFLFLQGRSSEIINCRGEKVHPAAVENAAEKHPDVVDAAAYADHSSGEEEVVRLAVQLSTHLSTMESVVNELAGMLKKSLGRAEMPQSILVVDQIPREQSGKLRRHELAAKVRQRLILEFTC